MKIYLASSFSLVPRVQRISDILEENGYNIICKWWKRAYKTENLGVVETTELKKMYDNLPPEEFYSRHETKWSYEHDFKGVKDADILILIANDFPKAYNGANIELGIALSDEKPCFSLGVLENSVLYYPVKKCKTVNELLIKLKVMEWLK
jgi:hypothetical protein